MTVLPILPVALNPTMPIGMLAGLLAAYGRELSMRRRPGWRWWLSRILVLPAAAIASVAIEGSLGLSAEARTLIVMLAVFRGYDGLTSSKRIWPPGILPPAYDPHLRPSQDHRDLPQS